MPSVSRAFAQRPPEMNGAEQTASLTDELVIAKRTAEQLAAENAQLRAESDWLRMQVPDAQPIKGGSQAAPYSVSVQTTDSVDAERGKTWTARVLECNGAAKPVYVKSELILTFRTAQDARNAQTIISGMDVPGVTHTATCLLPASEASAAAPSCSSRPAKRARP